MEQINWKGEGSEDWTTEEMTIDKFLSYCPSPATTMIMANNAPDEHFTQSSIEFYRARFEAGEETYQPTLDFKYKNPFTGLPEHDGRHRAFVAREMGHTHIPVSIRR